MKKNKLIPFSWMPASWGLRGPAFAEAEAAYYCDGEELDRQLAQIRFSENETKLAEEVLRLDHKYGKLNEYEFDLQMTQLKFPEGSRDLELAYLDLDLKHARVTEMGYQKDRATLLDEPWVGILESGFDPDKGVSGLYFTLDWNPQWIAKLAANGYNGQTEQQIIDMWFAEVCRSQGMDAMYNNVVPFGA
jgi:hypothetical protein